MEHIYIYIYICLYLYLYRYLGLAVGLLRRHLVELGVQRLRGRLQLPSHNDTRGSLLLWVVVCYMQGIREDRKDIGTTCGASRALWRGRDNLKTSQAI